MIGITSNIVTEELQMFIKSQTNFPTFMRIPIMPSTEQRAGGVLI
jgi:hypothetical protein